MSTKDSAFFNSIFSDSFINETPYGNLNSKAEEVKGLVGLDGMSQKGIRCATGAVAFIPPGFIVNIIGVPILLVSFKNANKKSLEV